LRIYPFTAVTGEGSGAMVQSLDDARRRSAAVGRVPPHNLEAEESLLGAMLLSKDAIAAAVEVCSADDFYKPAHGHVFDAITSLYSQGEAVDPVTVADELRRAGLLDAIGGAATLLTLQSRTPATSTAGSYARIVEEHALLRRLIGVGGEIAELGYELPDDVVAAVDTAETLVFQVAQRRITDSMRRAMAPVNAPFSWPNSSDSSRCSGIAAQLMLMNGFLARLERLWTCRASTSLPVPDSPVIMTEASEPAICCASLMTFAIASSR